MLRTPERSEVGGKWALARVDANGPIPDGQGADGA